VRSHGSWVANLSKIFEHVGLQDVLEDRAKKDSWHLSNSEDVTMLAMEEISLRLPNRSEVQEMIQKAALEFENNGRGVSIASDRVTVIGRKP